MKRKGPRFTDLERIEFGIEAVQAGIWRQRPERLHKNSPKAQIGKLREAGHFTASGSAGRFIRTADSRSGAVSIRSLGTTGRHA